MVHILIQIHSYFIHNNLISQLKVSFQFLIFKESSYISSLGRQDLVTQFLVKITLLYKPVAKKLDFVLSKLQISIWKDRATVAW